MRQWTSLSNPTFSPNPIGINTIHNNGVLSVHHTLEKEIDKRPWKTIKFQHLFQGFPPHTNV
ncbi:hypothetical protein MA16_Dca007739 [Dendrobium catenatum]|uniref:Uncharacterized protein n=1 Tax=Dendrobium catenatum TaxID=906689 RepID=A0A2I0X569_9ASPA|nr:hypothetical protein MA16_Dca007739 [Dendrobium catenatum]